MKHFIIETSSIILKTFNKLIFALNFCQWTEKSYSSRRCGEKHCIASLHKAEEKLNMAVFTALIDLSADIKIADVVGQTNI